MIVALAACSDRESPAVDEVSGRFMAPVQEMTVRSEALDIHVRRAGNPDAGEILVAINGGPGQSSEYMLDLERLAGPDLAVVTYDQRGTGRSDSPPPQPDNFELADYVADLEAIRQTLGMEKIHLLGHSWGALIAIAYATTHPENTGMMILMGGASSSWDATQAGMRRFSQHLDQLQRAGVISSTLPSGVDEQFEAILPAYLSDPAAELEGWQAPTNNQRTNSLTWTTVRGYDLSASLSQLTLPVLILWGQDDPFGQEMAQATRDALVNAEVEYILLPRCGHYWHECPEPFYSAVSNFLQH
jgi:pimeloyl-ACP methyl ester carboxylesterase